LKKKIKGILLYWKGATESNIAINVVDWVVVEATRAAIVAVEVAAATVAVPRTTPKHAVIS
jgi:hypothetical protein